MSREPSSALGPFRASQIREGDPHIVGAVEQPGWQKTLPPLAVEYADTGDEAKAAVEERAGDAADVDDPRRGRRLARGPVRLSATRPS